MKNKILLLALGDWDLYKLMVANLQSIGFEVTLVLDKGYRFRYSSFIDRIINLLKKLVFNDRSYKKALRKSFDKRQQLSLINSNEKYNFCLVIRADLFDRQVLDAAKQRSACIASYHYDGIANKRDVLEVVHLFDRFYVFDIEDLARFPNYPLHLASNFYFDHIDFKLKEYDSENPRFFFLGTYYPSRIDTLIRCYDRLLSMKFDLRFELFLNVEHRHLKSKIDRENIFFLNKVLPYAEYLKKVNDSDVLLDFVISEHKGMSFRIFEGLHFKKKVVTTNSRVRDMDFYHENNYFVLEDDNYSELNSFLDTPYVAISPEISEKYGFSNWFRRIFDLCLD